MRYTKNMDEVSEGMIEGFFVGWPKSPSPQKQLELMKNSYRCYVAIDEKTDKVIGFITAISDGVLSAYIPLLEVLPEYQDKGIGSELVKLMLSELDRIYMIDLLCDQQLQNYYDRFQMMKAHGMMVRNYSFQGGK
ncbi:GNAT family N-acetyltransferase [Neobacillus sp. D3-1R]|uniref:GNAT family N-acetyltransferase n=1 Tax=Neobacillus sp. D3-1R TaxID=3445778 RepID=UPI003FA0E354